MRHDMFIWMGGSGGGGCVWVMWDVAILYCYAISLEAVRLPHIQYVLFAAMHRLTSLFLDGFHPYIFPMDGGHVSGDELKICYLMVYVEM